MYKIKYHNCFVPLPDINTLYNVCAVPWGCSVPWGDIMSTVGGYLEYRGGVQYRGGYHDKCGGIS